MPIPTITPSYVRTNANWGEYQPYIFRFLYTIGVIDYYYDCYNIPEGWNAQSIKITRNRNNIGLVRTYAEGVTFIGDDAIFLLDYFNTYRFNIKMKVEIYELNTVTIDYDLYYSGFADFTKFSFKDFKFKLDLIDNQVQSLIDNNGDKEYSLLPADYTPYLFDYEYSGIEIFEIAEFKRTTTGLQVPDRGSRVAPAECFINLSTTAFGNVDTKLTEFNLISSEIIEYYGNPTQATAPIIVIKRNGSLHVDINYQFAIYWTDGAGIKPIAWDLRVNNGSVDMDSGQYTLGSGTLSYDGSNRAVFSVVTTADFSVVANEELFLMLRIIRDDQGIGVGTDPFTLYHNIGTVQQQVTNTVNFAFKETYTPKLIKGIRFDHLLQLSLSKVTNDISFFVNNSDVDFSKVFMFNGNLIRDLLTYNLNVKLNDLLTFIMRKYGLGYEMDGDNLTFYNMGDFFDITQVGYTFDEPANFEIISNTDLIHSTIKSGDKPFDSEYLSGKFSVHEETIFKTPVDVVTNELNLMCEISTNPFEIEDMVRNAIDTETLTDYEGDYQLVAILSKLKSTNLYQIDRDGLFTDDYIPADYFYPTTIYNLKFSPIRIIERNLMYAHQTLYNDCDTIKAQKRTKYEDFYCAFAGENIKYEFADFKIFPRCTGSDPNAPHLTNSDYKIEPKTIQFTIPTTQFNLSTLLANAKKKMEVTSNGVNYYGFLDDSGVNLLTNEEQTVRLIEAHATT